MDHEELLPLLYALCEGSADAFDRFYAVTAPFIMRIALSLTGSKCDAEDICHDVFLEVLRKGAQYDPSRGSVASWLAVITRSRCIDRLRRNARTIPQPDITVEDGHPMASALEHLEAQAVRSALSALPSPQRDAIVGAYYAGLTHQELAQTMRLPLGTVKSRIRYGLNSLKRALYRLGWADDECTAAGKEAYHGSK